MTMTMVRGQLIVPSPYVPPQQTERVQFRFPRSKKRRIRAKWAKRTSNWKTVSYSVAYCIQGIGIVCHPSVADEIRAAVANQESARLLTGMYERQK